MKPSGGKRHAQAGAAKVAAALHGGATFAAIVLLIVIGIVKAPAEVAVGPSSSHQLSPGSKSGSPSAEEPIPAQLSESAAQGGQVLRIATWNLRDCSARNPDTGAAIPFHDAIAGAIRDARIDVAIFQEIQSDAHKGGDIALLSVALAKSGWAMPYTFIADAPGEDDLAIFSKFPLKEPSSVLTPAKGESWPRPGVKASLDIGDSRLDLYGFHFKAMGDERSRKARLDQARALGALLKERYGDSPSRALVVVAGDFNTTEPAEYMLPDSTLGIAGLWDNDDQKDDFRALDKVYLPDAPTYDDGHRTGILDHLLVSPALASLVAQGGFEVLDPPPSDLPMPVSDHKLLVAEFSLGL